jgi:glyoxylase-like metal-dependent hydrolase (beta-lactamase superfamily II)
MKTFNDLKIFIDRKFLVNSYLVIKNNEAVLIDPGLNDEVITNYLNTNNIKLLGIILTHAHYDHIGNTFEMAKHLHINVYLHNDEKPIIEKHHYAQELNIPHNIQYDLIKYFNGSKLTIGSFTFDVLLLKGHTPGGVALKYEHYVFSGDTIFYDSIGRTDLALSNINDMKNSIKIFLQHYHDDD